MAMPPSCGSQTGRAEVCTSPRTRSLLDEGQGDVAAGERTGRPSLWRDEDPGGVFCSSPLSPPLPAPPVALHPQQGLNEDVTTVTT